MTHKDKHMTTTTKPAPVDYSTMTPAQMKAELDRLISENGKLTTAQAAGGNRKFTLKIGDKGGIVIGVPNQRFPINGYPSDIVALFEHKDEILAFIRAGAAGTKMKFGTEKDTDGVVELKTKSVLERLTKLGG